MAKKFKVYEGAYFEIIGKEKDVMALIMRKLPAPSRPGEGKPTDDGQYQVAGVWSKEAARLVREKLGGDNIGPTAVAKADEALQRAAVRYAEAVNKGWDHPDWRNDGERAAFLAAAKSLRMAANVYALAKACEPT